VQLVESRISLLIMNFSTALEPVNFIAPCAGFAGRMLAITWMLTELIENALLLSRVHEKKSQGVRRPLFKCLGLLLSKYGCISYKVMSNFNQFLLSISNKKRKTLMFVPTAGNQITTTQAH